MKKRFAISSILALALSACMIFSSCDGSLGNSEVDTDSYAFDPEQPPESTKTIVYLEGTPKEMGVQYGKQAQDYIARNISAKKSSVIARMGSIDAAYDALGDYEKMYEEKIPNIVEMWKGMAEGSGIKYEDILIAYTQFYNEPEKSCSTISMWGEATQDGKLVVGKNYDLTLSLNQYAPIVVAYPDKGNSFVAVADLFSGMYMNEKGLVTMSSLGQDAQEDDLGKALALRVGTLDIAMTCDTADEAKEKYINELSPGSGENLHIIDTDRTNYVIEHTMSKDAVRSAGDFGEKDYLIATNGFLKEEMQESLYSGDEEWDDWMPRLRTEERIILDHFGENTVDLLNDILGCTSYYDNGEWVEDVWTLDEYKGFWTPENREPGTKCQTRTLAHPEDLTMFVMQGCTDTYVSELPESTGNFCRLTLLEDKKAVTVETEKRAQMQIWLAARDRETADSVDKKKDKHLAVAKEALFTGLNYLNMAGAEEDEMLSITYYGKAATAFCKAQCYAQLAQNDTDQIIREGENYEVE